MFNDRRALVEKLVEPNPTPEHDGVGDGGKVFVGGGVLVMVGVIVGVGVLEAVGVGVGVLMVND